MSLTETFKQGNQREPEGRIYIASAFRDIQHPKSKDDYHDNDPHFWTQPPTWGICRFDLRNNLCKGDWVFFVLPLAADRGLPQMIFGYMRIDEMISHLSAFRRTSLESKQMGNRIPRGNIICDENFKYNRFDLGEHKKNFANIKNHYAIGDPKKSEFLTEYKIRSLAPEFIRTLNRIFGTDKKSVIAILGRSGRTMTKYQVDDLYNWLQSK